MEKHHQQFIRYQHYSARLPHSHSHNTSNNHNTNIHHSLFSRTGKTYRSSYSRSFGQISNREGVSSTGTTNSRLLQLYVRDSQKEWWRSSSVQSQTAQPVSGSSSLQDGNNQGSIIDNQTERLLGLNRFIRCLSACGSPLRVTTLPTSEMEGSSVPILHDRFWIVLKSLCVYQSLQTHFETLALSRLQDLGVLRRLVIDRQLQASSRSPGPSGGISSRGIGLDCQLQEISVDANSTTGTSWLCIEYPVHDSTAACQQIEGYSSLHQASTNQAPSTISQSDPQFDNEDTISNVCNLPSSSLHSSPIILQESNGQIGCRLGPTSSFGSSEHGGTSMVVPKHQQMERSISTSINPQSDTVRGHKQHGLGLLMEPTSSPWVLDGRRGVSIDQLERAQGSTTSSENLPASSKLHSADPYGQHDQPLLHQQARWYSLSSSTGISNRSLDMMSPSQDYDSSSTHSRTPQQDSRLRVSSSILQEPMDDQAISVSADPASLGPFFDQSICRQDNEVVTKLRVVDAGSGSSLYGCSVSSMDQLPESFRKSALESYIASREQNQTGTSSIGDSGGSLLAQCSVVSSGATDGSLSPMDADTTSGADHISSNSSPIGTAELDALRVAIIRQQLVKKNFNAQAVEEMMTQRLAPTGTNLSYRKNQLRFLEWALQHNVSHTSFTPVELVNFLADMKHHLGLQASTLKTLRAAVAHLHDTPQGIRESDVINSYIIDGMMKQAPPVPIHRPTTDISPALAFAQSITSKPTTTIKRLQQKLAFLLAMSAFLRPSDLARIPFASCSITDSGCLTFHVVAPKETRGKRRIIKPYTVHPHATDLELCPVQCFKALRDHPDLASRPPGSKLLVKSHLITQPLSSSKISSWLHKEFIKRCTSEPNVSIRSLASSRALDLGVSRDNIVTLGNWASSSTFQNHYQRNQMAQVNFTSTVLSEPMDQFYDASDDFFSGSA